jgi:hypothetical protein
MVRRRFAHLQRVASALPSGAGKTEPPPREPYVQRVTASSAVTRWVSAHPGADVVTYGKSPELGCKEADACRSWRHEVALTICIG